MDYLIAISGKAHSGKSTARKILMELIEQRYPDYLAIKLSFADKLKDIAKELFGWDGDKEMYYYMDNINTPVPDRGRQLLINIGQLMRSIRANVWADYVMGTIKDYQEYSTTSNIFIVDDLRFRNELGVLEKFDGDFIKLKIERDSSLDINDVSEKDLGNEKDWDVIITNDGNEEDLTERLKELLEHFVEYDKEKV